MKVKIKSLTAALAALGLAVAGPVAAENWGDKAEKVERSSEQAAEKAKNDMEQSAQKLEEDAAQIEQNSDNLVQKAKDKTAHWSEQSKEAWKQGKLESALMLNDHLSAFDIDTEVRANIATLNGQVKSDVTKELAEEIALGIDGIDSVENKLTVKSEQQQAKGNEPSAGQKFSTTINDATTTASVKMELVASEVKARDINVDTMNGIVTLKGNVQSEELSQLAEKIAKNTQGVKEVKNEIKIGEQMSAR